MHMNRVIQSCFITRWEKEMPSYWQVAKMVRLDKEKNPENFCPVRGCLWRIKTRNGDNPCRNHPVKENGNG
jgi:hypothetical protein